MPGPAKQNPGTASPGSGSGLRKRRPSLTETIVQTATDIEHRLELLLFNQLEPWRRDNPSILRGYRPTSYSFRASFRSLFYLHNESVNIWSHLLGAFFSVILATYLYRLIHPRFDTASSADILVFSCFFAGAFLCLGMSATYHAISNHSDKVAKWGNKLDYTGIVFLIVGSYVPALWYGFWCEPGKLTVYLGAVSFSSIFLESLLFRRTCAGGHKVDRGESAVLKNWAGIVQRWKGKCVCLLVRLWGKSV